MAKPFSIQSPEDIAKEYAGNKQRIAQAMQLGVVDPTAGVLAGMFIDRMRSAQMQEQAPQATVAQQVMGGAPATPPPPPSGGLGAALPVAPPMAPMQPPMQAPMPTPGGPPMGMAMGGLATLPVPDAMFDEPTNGGFGDGYAGGGLVAFANGGDIDAERLRRALRMQESGGDYGIMNLEGSGAMGAYQFMPDTARALAKRLGLPYRPDLMNGKKGRSKEGVEYQERLMDEQMKDILNFAGGDIGRAGIYHFAGPNEEGWGPKTRKYKQDILRRYSGSKDTGEVPERDLSTAEGRVRSTTDEFERLQRLFGPTAEEAEVDAARMARAKEMASDEYYEKQRKADMWQTLAEIGFNMASSKSPYLLQAVGEAAAASMPGARADKKERKALKDRALDVMSAMNGLKRKENLQLYGLAVDAAKTGMQAEEFERSMELKQDELDIMRDYRRDSLKIEEYKAKNPRSTTTEYMVEMYMKEYGGTPMNALAKLRELGLIGGKGDSGSGASIEELLKQQGGGSGAGTGGFTVTRE